MSDLTPQTPAPASAAEVLAAYDAAEQACADARTSIEYHEASALRRDATVRIVDHLRALAAAQPAPAPAEIRPDIRADAARLAGRFQKRARRATGAESRLWYEAAGEVLGLAMLGEPAIHPAQHPTPPAGVGAQRWVRLPREVRGDFPFQAICAPAGVYVAHTNPYGAVHVVTPSGRELGLRRGEFEWVEAPDAQAQAEGGP